MQNAPAEDLELILSNIENPMTRAKVGVSLFEGVDIERASTFATEYVLGAIDGKVELKGTSSHRDPLSRYLSLVPEEQRKSLTERYVADSISRIKSGEVKPNLEQLKNLISKEGIETEEAKSIVHASRLLSSFSFRGDPIPEDEIDGAYEMAWAIARNNTEAAHGRLFVDEEFKKRHSTNQEARLIALDLFEKALDSRLEVQRAAELTEAYSLTDLSGPIKKKRTLMSVLRSLGKKEETKGTFRSYEQIVRDSVVRQLTDGAFEQAEIIQTNFNYQPTEEDYQRARSRLENGITTKASSLDGSNIKQTQEVLKDIARLRSFDSYRDNGLDVESIPKVVVPEGYHGKILLVEFGEKTYVRSGGSMHREILEAFDEELKLAGFIPRAHQKGGAHLRFDRDGILIYDESHDYGECDKEEAKKLVASLYTDTNIRTEAAPKRSGW